MRITTAKTKRLQHKWCRGKATLIFWFSFFAFALTLCLDFCWLLIPDPRAAPADPAKTNANLERDNNNRKLIMQHRTLFSLLKTENKFQRSPLTHHHMRPLEGGEGNPLRLPSNMKIFVYDLPPEYNEMWTKDARCSNHLFAAEVAIHRILLSGPIRTREAEAADFFFVPVYVSCNFSSRTGFPTLGHARSLLRSAVQLISSESPFWNRSEGRDHIFVATHDYGACFHTMEDMAIADGIPEFLQKSIILQTFGRTDDHPCQATEHIVIPPYVSPSAIEKVWAAPNQERNIWAFFRGKIELHPKIVDGRIYSRGIRTAIWKRFKRDKRFFLKRTRSSTYLQEIERSIFCLCPLGWAPWSPRIVESVALGCVPVIIADNIALPFSSSLNWSQISLTVTEKDVPSLHKILDRVSKTNLTTIQANLRKESNRRVLLYSETSCLRRRLLAYFSAPSTYQISSSTWPQPCLDFFKLNTPPSKRVPTLLLLKHAMLKAWI